MTLIQWPTLLLITDCLLATDSLRVSLQGLSWTPGLPDGVHNNRPCPLVRLSLNILETTH